MPVEDRPIHPSTQTDDNHRYGCWNKPRVHNSYLTVKDGWVIDFSKDPPEGVLLFRTVPTNWIDKPCSHDIKQVDPACRNCEHI